MRKRLYRAPDPNIERLFSIAVDILTESVFLAEDW